MPRVISSNWQAVYCSTTLDPKVVVGDREWNTPRPTPTLLLYLPESPVYSKTANQSHRPSPEKKKMGSEASPRYFWGDSPDPDEYYATQNIRNHQSYFPTPQGRLFTQSFLPIDPASGDLAPVKASVFMTHGYGSDSGWLFQKIAISFAQWGFAVFCADLLGHGRSDGLRCYLGDLESVAAAPLSFFSSVRRRPDLNPLPAFLFGESMGGLVTLLIYFRSIDADLWTGIILSAPLLQIPDDMKPSRIRLFMYGLLFGLADTWEAMPEKNMVGKAIKDKDRLRVIAANPRRYKGRPRVGTMRELLRVTEMVQRRLGDIRVPFLAVHGTDDGLAAPEGTKMLYEMAVSEDKDMVIYENMYHSLIQGEPEENSGRVLSDMRRWIEERVRRYGGAAVTGGGVVPSGEGEKM